MEIIDEQENRVPVITTLENMMNFLEEHHGFEDPTELPFKVPKLL